MLSQRQPTGQGVFDKRYCLTASVRPEVDSPDRLFLLAEDEATLLQGSLFVRLVPLIDGRPVSALVAAMAPWHPAHEVLFGLMMLDDEGLLVDATVSRPARTVELAAMAEHIAQRIRGEVAVVLVADLTMATTIRPASGRTATARPWVPIVLTGVRPMLGPLFRPDQAVDEPCARCLYFWLMVNRPVERYLAARRRAPVERPPRLASPLAAGKAAAYFGDVLVRAIGDRKHQLHRSILSHRLVSGGTWHPVLRRPQCTACGDPSLITERATRPITLRSRPKVFTADGGHRICSPEETLERYLHLVDPVTGAASDLRPVAGRDHPMRPVYSAAWKACPIDREPTADGFRRLALGKGRTIAQARAGAVCEALERYSASWHGDEPVVHGAWADVDGAIHPDALQLFSVRQYARRAEYNRGLSDPRMHVPPPFDESASIDWTPAWSLTHQRRRHLPTAYCHSSRPRLLAEDGIRFDPNGHAAGNCLEEAILQGLLERIERDAVGIWWYARTRRAAFDLAALGVPWFCALREHYAEQGFRLWALDLTTDLGIPVCAALVRRGVGAAAQHCIGFGAHVDVGLAVQRALTELNQLFDPIRLPAPWEV